MIKRNKPVSETLPYAGNPDIQVKEELIFGEETILPGDKLRFKNRQGVFTFIRVAYNSKIEKEWIDVFGPGDQFKSFYVSELKSVIRPKKPRTRRVAK